MKIYQEYVHDGNIERTEISTHLLLSIEFITETGAKFRVSFDGPNRLKLSSANGSLSIEPSADNMVSVRKRL